jgi:hypothetical protein
MPRTGETLSSERKDAVRTLHDPQSQPAVEDEIYALSRAKCAVSFWLNAGVPATRVAESAGHSVIRRARAGAHCDWRSRDQSQDADQCSPLREWQAVAANVRDLPVEALTALGRVRRWTVARCASAQMSPLVDFSWIPLGSQRAASV